VRTGIVAMRRGKSSGVGTVPGSNGASEDVAGEDVSYSV